MNKELQTYYEARFSMMATQGWLDLIEDVETMIQSVDRIGGIPDGESLKFKQGELSILNWIQSLKSVSERAYEQLQEEE